MNGPASGELFTVVVRHNEKIRWGVVVRAADEGAARALVEAQGHTVEVVRPGMAAGGPGSVLGGCERCGYSLVRLPRGAAGEVMCPECGMINVPGAAIEARRQVLRARMKRVRAVRLVFYVLVGAVVLIGLFAALV
jgi:hypothetical protein